MTVTAYTCFHPVGQGLFSTGVVRKGGHEFRWIYDCGTTSSQKLVTRELDWVHTRWGGGRPTVDLVIVSHFDHDHISGLLRILHNFRVRNLLLPHLPFEQRLRHAFQSGIGHRSRSMRFLLDPVAYLRALGDNGPERILLVLPAAPDGQRGADEAAPAPDNPAGDRPDAEPPSLRVPLIDRDALDAEVLEDVDRSANAGHATVGAVASGVSLQLGDFWEFLPYNDASLMPKAPRAFAAAVRRCRAVLLKRPDQDALDMLKHVYDTEFSGSKKGRNLISLFLYAGSTGPYKFVDSCILRDVPDRADGTWYAWREWHVPPADGGGFLYTGDAYLDTPLRLRQFVRHLGPVRLGGAHCLQVMHHGSRKNWHAGVAAALRPFASIFSSNPHHRKFGHPHGEVVRDFLHHQPMQVDAGTGASIHMSFNHA